MTSAVLERQVSAADILEDSMDRPHRKMPEDLVELARADFIDFNAGEDGKFFVHDFVHSARELGYTDIEHGEAIEILEVIKLRMEEEYRNSVSSAINHYFDAEWLLNSPHGDTTEEFITMFNRGDLTMELAEEFSPIGCSGVPMGKDPINKIYDQMFQNDLHIRISDLIKDYLRAPKIVEEEAVND